MFVTLRRFNFTLLEKLTIFELPLKAMPDGVQNVEYEVGMDFFREMESTDVLAAEVKTTVEVKRSGDIYELCITAKGVLGIPCDRCLYEMKHEVDAEYRVSVKYGEEYNDENDNVIVIPESSNTMNVARIIYDTVMLTIPIKHVHPEGECDEEMQEQLNAHRAMVSTDEDMEDADCGTYGDEIEKEDENDFRCDPRWNALKKLKDNN